MPQQFIIRHYVHITKLMFDIHITLLAKTIISCYATLFFVAGKKQLTEVGPHRVIEL